MRRAAVALVLTAIPVALAAAPASADTSHPAALCGALNMVEASPTFYSGAVSDGMDIAMGNLSADGGQSINGWNNMFLAVSVSSGAQSPACQP